MLAVRKIVGWLAHADWHFHSYIQYNVKIKSIVIRCLNQTFKLEDRDNGKAKTFQTKFGAGGKGWSFHRFTLEAFVVWLP